MSSPLYGCGTPIGYTQTSMHTDRQLADKQTTKNTSYMYTSFKAHPYDNYYLKPCINAYLCIW